MEKLGQVEKVINLGCFSWGVYCVSVCVLQTLSCTLPTISELDSLQPFLLFDPCSVGEANNLLLLPAQMLGEACLELFFSGEVKNNGL